MINIIEFYSKLTIETWAKADELEMHYGKRTYQSRCFRKRAIYYLNQLKYWERRYE